MNKGELITNMTEISGLSKKDTEKALNSLMQCVEEALVNGDKIQLVGFGTFETRQRNARVGRNPQNPEETIQIPAAKVAAFKPGSKLKQAVNK